MMRLSSGRWALLAVAAALLASPASAIPVNWDIDPAQSSFKLAIGDQQVVLGTTTATMRLRNQNNAAWTTNSAPVDGFLASNVGGVGITSIEFLAGSSSLVGVNTANYRPNPAAFSTAATSTINTAGSFTSTVAAPGVYAARVNASVSFGTVNVGYIMFDQVGYDVGSAPTAVTAGSFVTNALNVGILDSRVGFDGISVIIIGQVVGDALSQTGSISAANSNGAAGSIVQLTGSPGGPGDYRVTIPINMPVFVDLAGVQLNAVATGTLVGYAYVIPEPTTIGLLALGLAGLAVSARRRLS